MIYLYNLQLWYIRGANVGDNYLKLDFFLIM